MAVLWKSKLMSDTYGNQSKDDPNVQFRSVKRIVTTEGWIKGQGSKRFDVSFMQVATPFSGIVPVKFENTPAQGDMNIGVVGYPGDLEDAVTKEKGAYMYEMFLQSHFNLTTQPDNMLQYMIDTFGGLSLDLCPNFDELHSRCTNRQHGIANS